MSPPILNAISRFAQVLILSLLGLAAAHAQPPLNNRPRVFLLDADRLIAMRARLDAGAGRDCGFGKVMEEADKSLTVEIAPVTAKPATPPSGDKHDYMSLAPYFWPDPKKKDGLPYIRRDGERNPEIRSIPDHDSLGRLVGTVEKLAQGYYLSRDERYAAKAASLLRMWFLQPATKMNPHLEYGQAVRGRSSGRNFGIIETRGLVRVVDSIGLLAGAKAWTDTDRKGLEKWFAAYLDWLLDSRLGKLEAAAPNNHGTHYDEQVVSFALFVGRRDLARRVLEDAKRKRIAAQIEPDGSQPLELARTRSWNYSTMNLDGFVALAKLGETAGVDLWNYKTPDGRGIRKAIEFLAPFALDGKKWAHKELSPLDPERLKRIVRAAGRRYTDERFAALVSRSAPAGSCPAAFAF